MTWVGRFAALAAAGFALAGCALALRTPAPEPHLQVVAEPAGAALSGGAASPVAGPVIAVGRFVDVRSAAERGTLHPPLRFAHGGLAREGIHRVGRVGATAAIETVAARDALATLRRAGAFAAVHEIDWHDDAPWPAASQADFVLVGRVEQVVGYQRRQLLVTPFRVGWIQRRNGIPWGAARIRYRLYAPHGRVWERSIEARHDSAGATAAQAALDALAVANERLALALARRFAREPIFAALRMVAVRVVDACGLGARHLDRIVGDASAILEREGGIGLDPTVEPWRSGGGARSLRDALAELRGVDPPPGGIVVGLVREEPPAHLRGRTDLHGLASTLGQHAVLACTPGEGPRPSTLAHEIAHLFGSVHVRERGSVMHATSAFDARFFDPWNREILRASRERRFGGPFDPALGERLRALYRNAARSPVPVDPADLATALRALGTR